MQGSLAEPKIHAQDWREPIRLALSRHMPEADVYCHYTRHPNSLSYGQEQLKACLEDGIQRAAECDLLVAYLPSASMGTAIEMYEAHRRGAVALTISPLAANWVIRSYSHRIFQDVAAFEAFLAGGDLRRLLEAAGRPGK